MPGFDNNTMHAENVDFRNVVDVQPQVLADGQLLIGSAVAPKIRVGTLASAGGTITITPGAGTINLEAGGSVPLTFTAENATTCAPILNNLNIVGTATNGINTTAAGSTLTISMATPFTGDFSFENNAVATPRVLMVENNDTDPGSYAAVAISAEPLGGDPYLFFEVDGATRYYSLGIDNSIAGDPLKLTNNVNPSSGDALVSVTSTGVITLFNDLDVTEGGTGVSTLTSHGILMGNGAGDIQATAEPSDGQLLIGDTGGFPILGTLTAGAGIGIANAAGSITITAGATVPTTFTAENASTCTPAVNNLNIVGTATNGINTTAAGSTMTIAMASPYSDGDFTFSTATAAADRALTVSNSDNSAAASAAHLQVSVGGAVSTGDPYINLLVSGAGTYSLGIDNSDSDEFKITTGASPSAGTELFTMTSAGVITLANDLDVTEGGTGVSTLTSHGILMGNGAGDINATAEPSNGQLLIGKTGDFPQLAQIQPGPGIAITSGAGSITVSAWGGGVSWTVETVNLNFTVNKGIVANKAGLLTVTLPATAAIGDILEITGINTAVGWRVAQNANQRIHLGAISSTAGVGGYIEATAIRDSVKMVCVVAGASTEYNVLSSVGNLTIV